MPSRQGFRASFANPGPLLSLEEWKSLLSELVSPRPCNSVAKVQGTGFDPQHYRNWTVVVRQRQEDQEVRAIRHSELGASLGFVGFLNQFVKGG